MTRGVALGGGAARGFAHIGVLQTLSKAGIEFDIVTGTSVGSLVGAVYASNHLSELEKASKNLKLTEIPFLLTPALSLHGFFSGVNALDFLSNFIAAELIEDLSKRFAAVSVDINSSEIVTHTTGNVRNAIRASMAIPCIFTPVIDDERILVDGGILEPIPVKAAQDLGADFVIAIDLFGHHKESTIPKENILEANKQESLSLIGKSVNYFNTISKTVKKTISQTQFYDERIPHIITILERTLAVEQQHLTKLRLKEFTPDIVIAPNLSDIGLFDFHRGELIIERGKQAAQSALTDIKAQFDIV